MKPVVSILFLGLASGAGAGDMTAEEFAARAQSLGNEINTQGSEQTEYCVELQRQVEALKGKPQRRQAAMQEYEAYCREGAGPATVPMTSDGVLAPQNF